MPNIYLSVLGVSANVVRVDGKSPAPTPAFAWGIKSATTINMYASGGNTDFIADLSEYTWRMAFAKDWNPATPPAYRIDSTGITVVDNALVMDVLPNTQELLDVLRTSPVANIKAELIGYQAGIAVVTVQFPVSVANRVDGAGEPEPLISNYYNKQETDDKFAAVGDAIPAATEGARGTISLATAAEAAAGTDPNKAITPATLGAVLEDAIPVIPPIPADLSDLSDTTGILTAKENVANKTQAIDAVTPSADKYTSEAAVVAHVAGLIPDVPDDLSELTDTTGILAGKVDVDGEKVLSDNNYTDADAAKVATINNATLETLSGADITVAPWGRYRWSASGVCSITLAGFAALGEEVAKIIITVATWATLSLPAGTVVEEGDVVDAAGVYETYIRVIDSVVYFRVVSFTEAA